MKLFPPPAPAVGCPERHILIEFNLGKLAFAHLELVATHVSSCAHCMAVLQTLEPDPDADSVVDWVKQCLARPPTDGVTGVTVDRSGLYGACLPQPVPLVHKQIGCYEVLETIGQGGMGIVYRARQQPVQRLVALKMIRAGAYAGSETVARFHTEGKAIVRLRHANVVQLHEFGEHDGLAYFSMELVEGGSLEDRLKEGPLGLREAAELVRTLAVAVEFAHRQNVIHRDLKPANVLLAEHGIPTTWR